MNRLRERKGVTITVLILAILILIILAGVTISSVIGDNGILNTAIDTKTQAEIETYSEELDILAIETKTEQINNGMSTTEYIDEYKEKVENSTVFEDSDVSKMTSTILRIQTPEGYVFYVTEDGTEYAGIDGEFEETYEISEEDIDFVLTPSSWTNTDVVVTIELNFDTTLTLQYSFDEETWEDYEDEVTVSTNKTIYVQLYGESSTISAGSTDVTNIDKIAPTVDSIEATTNTITFTASDTSSSSYGVSGIVGYYVGTSSSEPDESDFIDCTDEDGNGVTSLELTVDGLDLETTYYVWVVDDAGNVSEMTECSTYGIKDLYSGEELDLEIELGDYVDYPIDINEDGDTTNDWMLFYVEDATIEDDTISGQIFLITADYVPNDSEYLDLDSAGMTANTDYIYGLYWSSAPEKQWTDLMSETTNSLFMFNYSYGSSSTYRNMLATSTLLNTENWDGFVDEIYADYAIGGSTLEMWVASWNEKYGDEFMIYCDNESTYGYYIGTEETPTSIQILPSSMSTTSGLDDELYFPNGSSTYYGYWLASPSHYTYNALVCVRNAGGTGAAGYAYTYSCIRPIVMLREEAKLIFNLTNEVWEIDVSEDTDDDGDTNTDDNTLMEANITFNYSPEEVTDQVTVTISLNDELQELVDSGVYIIQYSVGDPTDETSWVDYTDEGVIFTQNGYIYARLTDGTNTGNYATGYVTNIDTIAPEVTIDSVEVDRVEITITGTATDDISKVGANSGVKEVYVAVIGEYEDLQTYYNDEGDPVYYDEDDIEWIEASLYEDGTFECIFEEDLAEVAYVVAVKAIDNVGNESDIAEDVAETEGDYVDYSAAYEVIEDGDSSNDWRLFYVVEEDDEDRDISAASVIYDEDGTMIEFTTTEDGQVYLIAADFILSENMPLSVNGTSMSSESSYPWGAILSDIYSEYVGASEWDSKTLVWNSYYLSSYSSSTNVSAQAIQYLLDTEAWGDYYLDNKYGSYAIGSPTIELWVEAWNSHGYENLYYNKINSYGYYIGTSSSPSSYYVYYLDNNGYYDTIFYTHREGYIKVGDTSGYCYAYWLASPAGYSNGKTIFDIYGASGYRSHRV